MKRTIVSLILCAALGGCVAQSTASMEQKHKPDYTTMTSKSVDAFRNCLVPKMESYNLMNGFAFDDRTVQVDVRPMTGGTDMYQKVDTLGIMTFVKVRGRNVSLYFFHNVSKDRWLRDLSGFINSCK